jgi:hypothetical protein
MEQSGEFDAVRLVLLAALAWLHEHDTGAHADLMDAEIDRDALARAIDLLPDHTHVLVSQLRRTTRILAGEITLPQAALVAQVEINNAVLDAWEATAHTAISETEQTSDN